MKAWNDKRKILYKISFDLFENIELIGRKLTFLIKIYSYRRLKFSLLAPICSLKPINYKSASITLSYAYKKNMCFNFGFSRRMKLLLPPNEIQKKIITCLRLCSFIDRADQDLLESFFFTSTMSTIWDKLSFIIVFHVLFSILFYKYYFLEKL